ncbi:MAG TPA: dienelactone hydrolase family protein [Gillisia sp.]|nr:dienelactone hydrolase family protein [Gillisia sp.]
MKSIARLLTVAILSSLLVSCALFKDKVVIEEEVVNDPTEINSEKTIIEQLSDSPRHHQWVSLKNGDREFQAFVVYPEAKEKTKAVIVIHENRGLDDWARLFADKLAAQGFLVIAPDMISNTQGKKRTSDFENPDTARDAIYDLSPAQVTGDLDAAYRFLKEDASSTGEIAVLGFCWGGSQTFRYATHNKNLSSAHVFYGTAPDDSRALAQITSPVYGYYGGDDNRVNATIEKTEEQMKAAGKTFEYEIYDGAGHAYMKRAHLDLEHEANKEAHDASWERLLNLLNRD